MKEGTTQRMARSLSSGTWEEAREVRNFGMLAEATEQETFKSWNSAIWGDQIMSQARGATSRYSRLKPLTEEKM